MMGVSCSSQARGSTKPRSLGSNIGRTWSPNDQAWPGVEKGW